MDAHVEVERRDGILSLMLARPERRNAITVAMYAALADAIESAADDPSVRLITIEGQGDDFTAGNDLADFLQAMPLSVSGCLNSCLMIAGGAVITSAPILAASRTWIGVRTLATRICVGKS